MKTKRLIYGLLLSLCSLFVMNSCDDNSSTGGSDVPDVKNALEVTDIELAMTGTTVTIQTSLPQPSIIYQSTFGLLYVSASELGDKSADELFASFKDGGNTTGFNRANGVGLEKGYAYKLSLSGLTPSSKYWCCGFVTTPNGDTFLSKSFEFTTGSFTPDITTGAATSVRFYDAVVGCGLNVSEVDRKSCTYGVVFSTQKEPTTSNGKTIAGGWTNVKNNTVSIKIPDLGFNTTYYYRTYVCLNKTDYFYGDTKSFTTRHPDEMAVDLGLSVKWAAYNLGVQDSIEYGTPYAWGATKSYAINDYYGFITADQCEWYDKSTDSYIYPGENISGTEHDIATQMLGGKWRTPTRAEFEELVKYCSLELWSAPDKYKCGIYECYRSNINGKSIIMPLNDYLTASYGKPSVSYEDTVTSGPLIFYCYDNGMPYFLADDFLTELQLRPVCDY